VVSPKEGSSRDKGWSSVNEPVETPGVGVGGEVGVGVEVLGADASVGLGVRVGAVVSVGVGAKVGTVVSVGVEVKGGTGVSVGSRVEVKVVVGRKLDASGDNWSWVGGEVTAKAAGTVRAGLFTVVGGEVRGSGVAVAGITAAAAGVARAG